MPDIQILIIQRSLKDNGNRINIGRYGNTACASLSGIDPVQSPEESVVFRVYDNRFA